MANTKVPVELSSTPSIVDNGNATAITIDSSDKVSIGSSQTSKVFNVVGTYENTGFYRDYSGAGIGANYVYIGRKDTNGALVEGVRISGGGDDAVAASHTGYFELAINKSGTFIPLLYSSNGTELVVNESSVDLDFRVESNSNTHMLFVDSGNDRVGINTTSPTAKLDIRMSDSNGDYGRGRNGNLNLENTNTAVTEGGWLSISGYMGNTASSGQYPMGYISGGKQTTAADGDYGGYLTFWTTSGGANGEANSAGYERLRIRSDGGVGINSSGYAGQPLTVNAGSGDYVFYGESTDALCKASFRDNSSTANIEFGASGNNHIFSKDGSTQMTIDASGNLLVGTTTLTPYYTGGIRVHSASSVGNIRVSAGDKTGFDMMADSGGTGYLVVRDNAGMTFHTNNAERMRITSAGRQKYNTSATENGHGNFVGEVGSSFKALCFERTVGGGEVGSVVTNSSSTSYNTSSDYRLKENVDYDFNALDRVAQLKPARFNFIADEDTTVDGFLAHEVQDIIPEAVTGEKDAVKEEEYEVTPAVLDDDGNVVTEAEMGTREVPDYQGIDQSKLVPLLTKAIQEQQTLIDDLKSRIETLEG